MKCTFKGHCLLVHKYYGRKQSLSTDHWLCKTIANNKRRWTHLVAVFHCDTTRLWVRVLHHVFHIPHSASVPPSTVPGRCHSSAYSYPYLILILQMVALQEKKKRNQMLLDWLHDWDCLTETFLHLHPCIIRISFSGRIPSVANE